MDRENLLYYLNALNIKTDLRQSRPDKIVAYCPFAPYKHKNKIDHRPSFAAFVNDEGLSGFLCMACRQKGTIGRLIHKLGELRGEEYPELLDQISDSEEYGLTHFPEYETMLTEKSVSREYEPLNKALYHGIYESAAENELSIEYLAHRDISPATATSLGLLFDDEEARVLFPIYGRDNSLYGFSGRSIFDGEAIKVKDYAGLPKKAFLLGEHKLCDTKPVLVVEGLFGYAHLHEVGADKLFDIVAVLGMVLTPEKAATLIEHGKPVYLLFDNDNGGDLGTYGTGENGDLGAVGALMGFVPLYLPAWPENLSDPDQLTLADVQNMLNETDPLTPEDLKN